MAVNRYRPHLFVLPEDDATRSIATGFVDRSKGQVQVLKPAGGWSRVLEECLAIRVAELRDYKDGHLVLLIDFDDDFPNRLAHFQSKIPGDVADRVYVLGALGEAEDLKQMGLKLGSLGQTLAEECDQGRSELWMHQQLQHNQAEVQRLQRAVKSFLF